MASLSGVSSSNTLSSLMNSANMISGLASGLDTEGMIESLVKSYQTKINQLNQKVTKVEWKQDAYRSIISSMYSFANRYTSYTSNTNLLSAGFFSSAVKVAALGKYADAVSASGKTSSNITLNAVHQLATSAQYRTSSNLISGSDSNRIEASDEVDLNDTTELSVLNGNLTLTYGSQDITISFDQVADVEAMNEIRAKLAEEKGIDKDEVSDDDVLAGLINQKLSGQTISLSGGKTADATDRIRVTAENGRISFSDKSTAGNSVYISSASDSVSTFLGIKDALDNAEEDWDKPKSFALPEDLTVDVDNKEYLSGRTMNMSLDGVTKTITLPTIVSNEEGTFIRDSDGNLVDYNAKNYTKVLNDAVQAAFKGKVKVSNEAADADDENSFMLKLRFDVQEGSNLVINAGVGKSLGIGQIATSYLNTSKTLGELMGDKLNTLTPARDKDGKELLDKNGDKMYDFVLNGVKVGSYSKNSTLAELMNDINKSDAGVSVTYSQTTKKFLFESKETGVDSQINFGGGLAAAMFGEDHGSKKISDVLGGNVIDRKFSFTIDGESFSGEFLSDSGTMKDLVNKLNNEILNKSEKGYKAYYSEESGLVIKQGDQEVAVTYGDDAFGEIVKASKPADRSQDKLVDILGGGASIQGDKFSFTIDGESFDGEFLSNSGTMQDLVNKLNNEILNKSTQKHYEASYSKERGLVIKDKDSGEEVKVTYAGDDNTLKKIADASKPENRETDKLVDILDRDTITPKSKSFEFNVNGKTYTGEINSNDMTMDDLLNTINSAMKDSGYTASYSSITGELVMTDYLGREVEVNYGDSILGDIVQAYGQEFKAAEDNVYTKGQDAIFDVTVNGEKMQMTRSSNNVDIDGLTITMKDTFNSSSKVDDKGNSIYEVENDSESVSFKTSTDSDKIVDAIKSMVADYNAMMAQIKSAYSTMPYQTSSGAFANYEPLTDDDRAGMSESAIERYEEKAKQGILFGDRTLSTLYTKLNQAFSFSNTADVDTLKDMGITVSYSLADGAQAVTIDENKLRAMLDSDPDRVADLFTKSDGIMDRMKTQLDNYGKTTGEPKGILVQQAGTPLSSLSLLSNTWQSEIENYTKQIERWQSKLETQVERYTSQFARLEQLINQMNSQSSTLAGLLGGS